MDFKQIEAFVNVVKYKNFSRAADATFLTQPTISTHINNLEKELRAVLLNRQGREVTMTKQGELFYSYATSILNLREQAMLAIWDNSQDVEGIVNLEASSIPGQYYTPMLLGAFRGQCPRVKIFLEQTDSHTVIDNIINKKCDIGFAGIKLNNNLVYEELFTDDMLLVTPNRGKFAAIQGDTVKLEDIVGEDFVLREDGSGTKKAIEKVKINDVAALRQVNVVAHINNLEAIKNAVIGGLGITILSACAAKDIMNNPQIRCFKIADFERKRHFYMVRNRTYCLSPAAERFWNFVIEQRDKERMEKNGGED